MSARNSSNARLGWVNSPDGWGTIDIIWGCILPTILCVWTVLTLNVLALDTTLWAFTRIKLKWAIIAPFGPKWLSAMAGAQWPIARRAKKQFQDDGIKWTMEQSFFADMCRYGWSKDQARGRRVSGNVKAYLPFDQTWPDST